MRVRDKKGLKKSIYFGGNSLDWWLKKLNWAPRFMRSIILKELDRLQNNNMITSEVFSSVKQMIESLDDENVIMAVSMIEYWRKQEKKSRH